MLFVHASFLIERNALGKSVRARRVAAAGGKMGHMGSLWVVGGCGGRGTHARTTGSVGTRLTVGCVRAWRRGGTAAASRVHPSWVVGGCAGAVRRPEAGALGGGGGMHHACVMMCRCAGGEGRKRPSL